MTVYTSHDVHLLLLKIYTYCSCKKNNNIKKPKKNKDARANDFFRISYNDLRFATVLKVWYVKTKCSSKQ